MDLLTIALSVAGAIVLPWCIWITKSMFDVRQSQAINKILFESLKEDIAEIKEALHQLVSIQQNAHPIVYRTGRNPNGSKTAHQTD